MADSTDVVVIGAGHNGLVAANYLARAGRRVTVVEARDVVGGACVSEELIPGSKWSSCAFILSMLRPQIIRDLELERFGLEMYESDCLGFSLFKDGSHFFLWPEIDRTLREIERYSKKDAQSFLEFGARLKRFADFCEPWLLRPPPTRAEFLREFELAGEQDLYNEFVLLSTRDLLDRYFESEHLKGFFNFFGMVSIWGGPSTPGTSYVYGHHSSGEFKGTFGRYGYVRGGMGGITQALANGAREFGAEIRTGSPVSRVLVEGGRVKGVRLEDGSEIHADVVVSNADPKVSMLKLLEQGTLDSGLEKKIQRIDQRGSMARIHLLISELPAYLGFDANEGPQHHGHQMLGASVENFELAAEAQRRGVFPDEWVIEAVIQSTHDSTLAPAGKHTLTLGVQQLPYELADGKTWDDVKEEWADSVIADLVTYAPNLKDKIEARHIITPLDLEREYRLTGGNIFHAAMYPDQLFDARPIPELSRYSTPIEGYYLCGAGTHPGGGVMGAPGHNAAKTVLGEFDDLESPETGGGRRKGAIDRIMASEKGSKLSYELARQPLLRPLAGLAQRKKSK